jgi:hypothetical protein
MTVTTADRPNWRAWGLAAAIGIIVACGSTIFPYLRHQWLISFVRQPVPYTVLAFTDATQLPVTALRGTDIALSFAITNDEGRTVHYRYVVASGSGATLTPIQAGSRTVGRGGKWTVNTAAEPECADRECRIQVSLPGQGEHIDFLVRLTNGRR